MMLKNMLKPINMIKALLLIVCLQAGLLCNAQVIIFKNCRIVSSHTPNVSEIQDMVVKNGKIISITPQSNFNQVQTGKDTSILDIKGKYIIPGLIDAHVHLTTQKYASRDERIKTLNKDLSDLLHNGVTSVRDVGGDGRLLQELQRASALNEIASPYIYYCAFMAGPMYYKESASREELGVAGSGKRYTPWQQLITNETNLDEAMLLAKGSGATGVKIYADITGKLLKRMATSAKKHGLKVWSHATLYPAKPSDAVKAGVEVISHANMLEWEQFETLSNSLFDNYKKLYPNIKIDFPKLNSLLDEMKKADIILDATLYTNWVNKQKSGLVYAKLAHEKGIKICAGTDYIDDKSKFPILFNEMDIMVKHCGFTPWEAIQSATLIGAEAIGVETKKGSVEVGFDADFVILNDNPILSLESLKTISGVVKNGIVTSEM